MKRLLLLVLVLGVASQRHGDPPKVLREEIAAVRKLDPGVYVLNNDNVFVDLPEDSEWWEFASLLGRMARVPEGKVAKTTKSPLLVVKKKKLDVSEARIRLFALDAKSNRDGSYEHISCEYHEVDELTVAIFSVKPLKVGRRYCLAKTGLSDTGWGPFLVEEKEEEKQ